MAVLLDGEDTWNAHLWIMSQFSTFCHLKSGLEESIATTFATWGGHLLNPILFTSMVSNSKYLHKKYQILQGCFE